MLISWRHPAVKLGLPLLVFIWVFSYLTTPRSAYKTFLRQFKSERKLYEADFLQHEVGKPFDGAPIEKLCASRTWTPGLILSCDPPPGGIGEVKNAILTCIRFGIEMGAELVLPDIIKRSEIKIEVLVPHDHGPRRGIPLEYFFDRDHLENALATHCPQMKIYRSMSDGDLYDHPGLLHPPRMNLGDLTNEFMAGSVMSKPQELAEKINAFMDSKSPPRERKYPFRVHLMTPSFAFPTSYDPPDFADNFGRILRIREDARRLAAAALFNMQKMFRLNLNPKNSLKSNGFIGVHLRTEKDVQGVFPSYEDQAADYLDVIVENKIPVIYLATGATKENVTHFRERAEDFNATTVLKTDILEGSDLEALEQLSWDQRALVDYEVMLRAGLMVGTSMSSFAWNLALRRKNTYGYGGDVLNDSMSETVRFKDDYSIVFGRHELGKNIQLSIWP